MTTERKAFKTIYRLIADGAITETEAYNLTAAVFETNFQFLPAPVAITPESEEQPAAPADTVVVRGFAGED